MFTHLHRSNKKKLYKFVNKKINTSPVTPKRRCCNHLYHGSHKYHIIRSFDTGKKERKKEIKNIRYEPSKVLQSSLDWEIYSNLKYLSSFCHIFMKGI